MVGSSLPCDPFGILTVLRTDPSTKVWKHPRLFGARGASEKKSQLCFPQGLSLIPCLQYLQKIHPSTSSVDLNWHLTAARTRLYM